MGKILLQQSHSIIHLNLKLLKVNLYFRHFRKEYRSNFFFVNWKKKVEWFNFSYYSSYYSCLLSKYPIMINFFLNVFNVVKIKSIIKHSYDVSEYPTLLKLRSDFWCVIPFILLHTESYKFSDRHVLYRMNLIKFTI